MPSRNSDPKELARELASLSSLSLDELKSRWRSLYKRDAPDRLGRLTMERAIGYQLQVNLLGGLSPATRRLLDRIADGADVKAEPETTTLEPGTRLLREWGGSMHEVIVLDDGLLYQGVRYRSLTEVAKKITGAHWSGPRFFGQRARGAA